MRRRRKGPSDSRELAAGDIAGVVYSARKLDLASPKAVLESAPFKASTADDLLKMQAYGADQKEERGKGPFPGMSKALVGMKKGGERVLLTYVKKSGAFVVVDMEVAKVKFKRSADPIPSQAPAPTPVPAAAQQQPTESSPAIQGETLPQTPSRSERSNSLKDRMARLAGAGHGSPQSHVVLGGMLGNVAAIHGRHRLSSRDENDTSDYIKQATEAEESIRNNPRVCNLNPNSITRRRRSCSSNTTQWCRWDLFGEHTKKIGAHLSIPATIQQHLHLQTRMALPKEWRAMHTTHRDDILTLHPSSTSTISSISTSSTSSSSNSSSIPLVAAGLEHRKMECFPVCIVKILTWKLC